MLKANHKVVSMYIVVADLLVIGDMGFLEIKDISVMHLQHIHKIFALLLGKSLNVHLKDLFFRIGVACYWSQKEPLSCCSERLGEG